MMPCYEMIRHATPDLYTLIESEPAQGRTPRCAAQGFVCPHHRGLSTVGGKDFSLLTEGLS